METLKDLIERGKIIGKRLEVVYHEWEEMDEELGELDTRMFISDEGVSLIHSAPEELQLLVELVQSHYESICSGKESQLIDSYEFLGGMGEGNVYKIPIKEGLEVAVKVYHGPFELHWSDDHSEGLDYFNALIKTRRDNFFDTVTPFIATRGYLFMSSIPDIPDYENFVAQHPELELEVKEALFDLQRMSGVKDVGLDLDWFPGIVLAYPDLKKLGDFERFLFFEEQTSQDYEPLDEINVVLDKDLMPIKDILDLMENHGKVELYFTGRDAPQEIKIFQNHLISLNLDMQAQFRETNQGQDQHP